MAKFTPAKTITGTTARDAEAPSLAVADNNVYAAWHENPTPAAVVHDVFVARSRDRGAAFGGRVNVSNTTANSDQEALAARDDDVYVAWVEEDPVDTSKILFRRSTNNGSGFGSVKRLSTAADALAPRVVAAGDDDVYVTWTAVGVGGTNDVYVAHSDDRGHSFDPEINVSGTDAESADPDVAAADDRVAVVWRQETPNDGFEIFYAQGR